jgi:hypothetical protein
VHAGKKDERLVTWLDTIALHGESDSWKDLARVQLIKTR